MAKNDDAVLQELDMLSRAASLMLITKIKEPADIMTAAAMVMAFCMVGTLKPESTKETAIEMLHDAAPNIAEMYIRLREGFEEHKKKQQH